MNFGFDDDERAWRDEIRSFVGTLGADEVLGYRAEMADLDVERHAPSFYAELSERGWIGLGWPEPHGHPATETQRLLLHEELDTSGLPMYGVEINEAIGWMLVRHGSPELRAGHLPEIVAGTRMYAGGYSEPEAGSDLLALRTRAERDGDVWRVNGSKLWTSAAHIADTVFAVVRTDPDSTRQHGLSILLIDTDLPGVTIEPVRVMGGWRVNLCTFEDVAVPAGNVVGDVGSGWDVLSQALDLERSISFGGREGRLWLARLVHRLAGRGNDVPEGRLEELGRFVGELEVERLLGMKVAAMGEREEPATAAAPAAKVYGSELAQRLAQWLADLLAPETLYPREPDSGGDDGAAAGTDPFAADIEEMLRVTTAYTVIGGTSEVQRNMLASHGLGLPRS